MAAKKLIRLIGGVFTEVFGTQVSAGAGNAGDVVSLDDTGRLDNSMMPVGIGADTKLIQASENLAAGDFVNVHNASGARARKADATVAGKAADGFVLAAVTSGNNATVFFEGTNSQVSGQTPGDVYLQTTAGTAGATAPAGNGNVSQRLGVAVSATEINFERGPAVTLVA